MTTHRFTLALIAGLTLAAAAPAEIVRGVITHVDLDKNQVIVEGRGKGVRGVPLSLGISDKTEVEFSDQAGALSDLAEGQRVRVRFDDSKGAQVIHVNGRRPVAAAVADVPPVPPVPLDADALTGVLRRVGYSDREVTLIGPGAKGAQTETTIEVPTAAHITKDGKDATLDDLKEGESASIQAEKKDGTLSALSIQVGPGAAPLPENRRARIISKIRKVLQATDQILKGIEDQHPEP